MTPRRQSRKPASKSRSKSLLEVKTEIMDEDEANLVENRNLSTGSFSTSTRLRGRKSSPSTSTSSVFFLGGATPPNPKQHRFFPIQSTNNAKDCLFNFSRKSSQKSKPRKLKVKTEDLEPVDVKIELESENELKTVHRNPLHKAKQSTPLQFDPSTSTNDNDMDTTMELTPLEEAIKIKDEEIRLHIHSDDEESEEIVNSDATGNNITLTTKQMEGCASFTEFKESLRFRECNLGVGIASFDCCDHATTGYLSIAPKTMKPMSVSQNVRVVLWVLKGEVTLRSTQYKTVGDKNILVGKLLGPGCSIMVPPFTPYMLENLTTLPVSIGYVMMSEESSG